MLLPWYFFKRKALCLFLSLLNPAPIQWRSVSMTEKKIRLDRLPLPSQVWGVSTAPLPVRMRQLSINKLKNWPLLSWFILADTVNVQSNRSGGTETAWSSRNVCMFSTHSYSWKRTGIRGFIHFSCLSGCCCYTVHNLWSMPMFCQWILKTVINDDTVWTG